MDHRASQFQYHHFDIENQAGTRGLQYAASKGLAVVIMKGLRGGALARNIPPAVQALWDSYSPLPGGQGNARWRSGLPGPVDASIMPVWTAS